MKTEQQVMTIPGRRHKSRVHSPWVATKVGERAKVGPLTLAPVTQTPADASTERFGGADLPSSDAMVAVFETAVAPPPTALPEGMAVDPVVIPQLSPSSDHTSSPPAAVAPAAVVTEQAAAPGMPFALADSESEDDAEPMSTDGVDGGSSPDAAPMSNPVSRTVSESFSTDGLTPLDAPFSLPSAVEAQDSTAMFAAQEGHPHSSTSTRALDPSALLTENQSLRELVANLQWNLDNWERALASANLMWAQKESVMKNKIEELYKILKDSLFAKEVYQRDAENHIEALEQELDNLEEQCALREDEVVEVSVKIRQIRRDHAKLVTDLKAELAKARAREAKAKQSVAVSNADMVEEMTAKSDDSGLADSQNSEEYIVDRREVGTTLQYCVVSGETSDQSTGTWESITSVLQRGASGLILTFENAKKSPSSSQSLKATVVDQGTCFEAPRPTASGKTSPTSVDSVATAMETETPVVVQTQSQSTDSEGSESRRDPPESNLGSKSKRKEKSGAPPRRTSAGRVLRVPPRFEAGPATNRRDGPPPPAVKPSWEWREVETPSPSSADEGVPDENSLKGRRSSEACLPSECHTNEDTSLSGAGGQRSSSGGSRKSGSSHRGASGSQGKQRSITPPDGPATSTPVLHASTGATSARRGSRPAVGEVAPSSMKSGQRPSRAAKPGWEWREIEPEAETPSPLELTGGRRKRRHNPPARFRSETAEDEGEAASGTIPHPAEMGLNDAAENISDALKSVDKDVSQRNKKRLRTHPGR